MFLIFTKCRSIISYWVRTDAQYLVDYIIFFYHTKQESSGIARLFFQYTYYTNESICIEKNNHGEEKQ